MSYLARLKNLKGTDTHTTKPTEPPQGDGKAGFVGFVAPYLASVRISRPPAEPMTQTPPGDYGLSADPVPLRLAGLKFGDGASPFVACNDPASPTALEPQPAPAVVSNLVSNLVSKKTADWQALDKAYQAHHVNCPTCIAAGKGYGLRCGTGAALWAEYDAADMPMYGKVSARVIGKVSPRVRTEAHAVDPLLTDTGNPASAARLALFDARGLSADDADALAIKLRVRGMEGDRRGACAECRQLVGYGPGRWKCGDRQHGINDLAGANLGAAFVHLNLHHCQSFKGAAT